MTHYKTKVRNFEVSTISPWNRSNWETVVFDDGPHKRGDGSREVGWYANEEEAKEGHEKIVQEITDNKNYKLPKYPWDDDE